MGVQSTSLLIHGILDRWHGPALRYVENRTMCFVTQIISTILLIVAQTMNKVEYEVYCQNTMPAHNRNTLRLYTLSIM